LDLGKVFPTDLGSPSNRLVHAARLGDFAAVRRCFLDHDIENLDLDSALDAAAAYAHADIVDFLVQFGATDLDSALLSAAARDHVKIAAYLISKERPSPATNTQLAQALAANTGAINCDWMLTAHRWEELRSS
jgi:ankyrin repeat protein